ncbi:MAG: ABC transporter ATP-binding protein [Oscillospiraceae bacterium]|nr:ABC transporter ATP-binding protein [Oscillospiraceae bacterium]
MSIIEVDKLSMGYDGRAVLENLSFQIKSGDYLCIVGENGSGKTTLMKGILGLNVPTDGKITYNGIEKKDIGYLPQKNVIQRDFPASVMEVVLSGCISRTLGPFHSKKDKDRAISNLKKVRMDDYRKKSFSELSGGQQQRVLLARALCATEKVIVLDEPVTGLDPIATADMYSLIKEINNNGITVIMVTHDINSAIHQASHILHISSNSSFFGSVHKYIHSDIGSDFLLTKCPCDDCAHLQKGETQSV